MSYPEGEIKTTDNSRRNILIVVSIFAVLVVAGLIFLLIRPNANSVPVAQQRLEGALHPGDPEFAQYRERIVLDTPEAMEGNRTVGDVWMQLETTVRNFTGRTITGLELKASVVDMDNNPVRERTVTIIPGQQPQLDNNKTLKTRVVVDGISKDAVRANIKMEVAGVKFGQ